MDCKLSSQSSGISLGDISIGNISDSELEDEETVLGSIGSKKSYNAAKPSHPQEPHSGVSKNVQGRQQNFVSFASSAISKNGKPLPIGGAVFKHQIPEHDRNLPKNNQQMPLGDVKYALQENHDLLHDHSLLNELLQSIDRKLASTSESAQSSTLLRSRSPLMSYAPPNRDPGPGLARDQEAVLQQMFTPKGHLYSSSDPILNEGSNRLPADLKILNKSVTFDTAESNRTPENSNSTLSGSHELLNQLSSLRWRLMGWEDIGVDPPTDQSSALAFCRKLLHVLQVAQEQKRLNDEEHILMERKLKKSTEEAAVMGRLIEKFEARLQEADAQLAEIQQEWISAHAANRNEVMRLRQECDELKKEKESLAEDLMKKEEIISSYQKLDKDYEKVKISLEESVAQVVASRRQAEEMAEENFRLTRKLEEKQKYLQEVEEVTLGNLKYDLEKANHKLATLETSNEKLTRTNTSIASDLRILRDQRQTLMEKLVEMKELKETVIKEKESLQVQVKTLTSKVSSTKTELHDYYQSQVEELVSQKTKALQGQLMSLEVNLRGSLNEHLEAERETHCRALDRLQKGHNKEVQELCDAHNVRVTSLQQQIQQLQEENDNLKMKHQNVIAAVSSIVTSQGEPQNSLTRMLEFPNMASSTPINNSPPVSPQSNMLMKGRPVVRCSSRPTSGKRGHSTTKVSSLGYIGSSSSDSDASVFQDGSITVRNAADRLQSNFGIDNKKQEINCKNVKPESSLKINIGEYRNTSQPSTKKKHEATEKEQSTGEKELVERKDPIVSSHKTGSFLGIDMPLPALGKIYRASEILQSDEAANAEFPNLLLPVDFELGRFIQALPESIRSSAKTSESDVPTHDTSYDQDPANVTLRKLNQVSTILSRYVNEAPSS
ncbi:putative leucine-rich repeat-containing protein DDB_G0290503 [Macrobrachium nipponense]|uniref:putative leucine-rich repeat-containing protein DDB_G0290503 n=1 Tax=Macrobrachium nipponense TaxID=159736 RepID=UPI0030C80EFE